MAIKTILLISILNYIRFVYSVEDLRRCPKRNGIFPKPGSFCKSFYSCNNWNLEVKHCPEDQHFFPEKGYCVWPEEFPCLEKPKSKECPTPDGKYLKSGTGCKVFYDCCNGLPTEKQCPGDLLFDHLRLKCEWPELYKCLDGISTDSSSQETTLTTPAFTSTVADASSTENDVVTLTDQPVTSTSSASSTLESTTITLTVVDMSSTKNDFVTLTDQPLTSTSSDSSNSESTDVQYTLSTAKEELSTNPEKEFTLTATATTNFDTSEDMSTSSTHTISEDYSESPSSSHTLTTTFDPITSSLQPTSTDAESIATTDAESIATTNAGSIATTDAGSIATTDAEPTDTTDAESTTATNAEPTATTGTKWTNSELTATTDAESTITTDFGTSEDISTSNTYTISEDYTESSFLTKIFSTTFDPITSSLQSTSTDAESIVTTDVESTATTDAEPTATTDAEPTATTNAEPTATTGAESTTVTNAEPTATTGTKWTNSELTATTDAESTITTDFGTSEDISTSSTYTISEDYTESSFLTKIFSTTFDPVTSSLQPTPTDAESKGTDFQFKTNTDDSTISMSAFTDERDTVSYTYSELRTDESTTYTVGITQTNKTTRDIATTTMISDDPTDSVIIDIYCPEPSGYFPHPTNRHKFIGCVGGIPYIFDCPSDLVYIHEEGKCDYDEN